MAGQVTAPHVDGSVSPDDPDLADLTPDEDAVDDGRGWRHPTINQVGLLAMVVLGLRAGLAPLADNSFMTHLATGRLILGDGAIPRSDPYSWSAPGEAWTVQSWLASVVYGAADRTVGLLGIRLISGLCFMVLIGLLWHLTRPGESLVGRLFPLGLAVAVGTGQWVERPLLFGAVFLVLTICAAQGDFDPRWMVPIMWLWVNMHGSFPLGVGFLVLVAAGRWLDDRDRPEVELRALAWALVGLALAMVNPLGPGLLFFPLSMLENREAFAMIAEWQPPEWSQPIQWIFGLQLVATVTVVATRYRRWRAILPLVAFGAAAVMSARNIGPASLVLTPILARGLQGVGTIDGDRRPPVLRPIAAALVALGVLVVATSVLSPNTALDRYPEDAVTWMRSNDLLDVDDRVVSRDYVGNYLEARYGPDEVRVFIDDRVDMYPIDVVLDYHELTLDDGDFAEVLEGNRATAVLWDRDSTLGRWLRDSPAWEIVHQDDDWLVAVPEVAP